MNAEIHSELETIIGADTDKTLKPKVVLEFAKTNRESAIGKWMESRGAFDTEKALEQWGLQLARSLIVSVKVSIEAGTDTIHRVRRYQSTLDDRSMGLGYRDVNKLITSEEGRRRLMQAAVMELTQLKKRYEVLKELTNVWREVEALASATAKAS